MSVAKKNWFEQDKSEVASTGNKPSPTRPDEMSGEVVEFIQAIDQYKRLQQRPFPSWSEVLEVLKALGYAKVG